MGGAPGTHAKEDYRMSQDNVYASILSFYHMGRKYQNWVKWCHRWGGAITGSLGSYFLTLLCHDFPQEHQCLAMTEHQR